MANLPRNLTLTSKQSTRLLVGLLGTILLTAAMVAPWWTRGLTETFSDQNPRQPGQIGEGLYASYGPYQVPGSFSGFSTDAGRATATTILGIAMTTCIVLVVLVNAIRVLRAQNRIETTDDVPVRLAIFATLAGTFAVLWGAFFLPLLGPNPGWLYGTEGAVTSQTFGSSAQFFETARYANVGFFLAIVGAVLYPAMLWIEAHTERTARASLNVTLDNDATIAAA